MTESNTLNARTERIDLRCTPNEKRLIADTAASRGMSITDYIRLATIQKPKMNQELLSIYNEIIKMVTMRKILLANKQESHMLYFDKNAINRIYDAAKVSIYATGALNMSEIDIIINNALALYEAMPEYIQKIKQKSMLELKNLSNEKYLLERLRLSEQQAQQIMSAHSHRKQTTSLINIARQKR